MFLNSFFKNNKTFTATVQTRVQTFVDGVSGPITWTTGTEADCIIWRGSMSDSLVSEKYRADVSAVAIFKPSDMTMANVPDDARIKIEDGSTLIGYYSVIAPDNIAGQDKVLMVPLKEWTDGVS